MEDWRNGTIRTVEDKFWPVELASAMGSALFTLRRGLQVAVQLLSTPDPKNLRRNAVYILFILGVPKVVWDVVRIKKSLGVFTKDEDKEKKDPPEKILCMAVSKAVVESRKAWVDCLRPYCPRVAPMETYVTKILDQSQRECQWIQDDNPPSEAARHLSSVELMVPDDDLSSLSDEGEALEELNSTEVETAELTFLKHWAETMDAVIITPLQTACNIKVEDRTKEKKYRNIACGLLCLLRALDNALDLQRRKIAFDEFLAAKEEHDAYIKARDHQPGNDDQLHFLVDTMNRSRQIIEELVSADEDITYYRDPDDDEDDIPLLDDSYYIVSPQELEEALPKQMALLGDEEVSSELLNAVAHKVHANKDHRKLWDDAAYNIRRLDMIEVYGDESNLGYDDTRAMFVRLVAESHIVNLIIDHALGNVRKNRLLKLLKFLEKEIIGTVPQRILMVISWILSVMKETIETAADYYQSNLLLRAVELVATEGLQNAILGTINVASSPLGLFEVLSGIIVLKVSSVLVGDLLGKVKESGEDSVRNSLSNKILVHILSQDLEEVDDPAKCDSAPEVLLDSVQNRRMWSRNIGGILQIPQDVFTQLSSFLSTGLLLWHQSPRLLAIALASLYLKKQIMFQIKLLRRWCIKACGLDKMVFDGWGDRYTIQEAVRNFEDMRVNAKELEILKDAKRAQEKATLEEASFNLFHSMFRPLVDLCSIIPTVVCAYFGSSLVRTQQVLAADFISFIYGAQTLTNKFFTIQRTLTRLHSMNDRRFQAGFRIMDLLIKKPKIGLDGGWKPSPQNIGDLEETASALPGDIEFSDVCFKYPGKQEHVCKHVSFNILKGSFVGICGERGAGKSTLFKLIMRLYDVDSGEIRVGGHPLKYYNPVWLRKQIGLSKQSPSIFRFKTLRDNVLYGSESLLEKMGPLEADKYIEGLLKKANIWHHFQNKEKFPQGLSTICPRLSGGEKRSVGTARALVGNPPILLLDEPTEGLDAVSEKVVVDRIIGNRPAGQTVLAIAHRLSTLKSADYIIFLDKDGSIAEKGTWNELVNISNGKFAEFKRAQSLEDTPGSPVSSRSASETQNFEHTADAIQLLKEQVASNRYLLSEEVIQPFMAQCDRLIYEQRVAERALKAFPRRNELTRRKVPFHTNLGISSAQKTRISIRAPFNRIEAPSLTRQSSVY